jgi:hypothetical protein
MYRSLSLLEWLLVVSSLVPKIGCGFGWMKGRDNDKRLDLQTRICPGLNQRKVMLAATSSSAIGEPLRFQIDAVIGVTLVKVRDVKRKDSVASVKTELPQEEVRAVLSEDPVLSR